VNDFLPASVAAMQTDEPTHIALARRIITKREELSTIQAQAKVIAEEVGTLEVQLLETMRSMKSSSFKADDLGRRFQRSTRVSVSARQDQRERLCEWLDENGFGSYKTVNPQALTGLCNEIRKLNPQANGDPGMLEDIHPELVDLVNVFEKPTLSIVKV